MTETTPRTPNAPAEATHVMQYQSEQRWPVEIRERDSTTGRPIRVRVWQSWGETPTPESNDPEHTMVPPTFATFTPYADAPSAPETAPEVAGDTITRWIDAMTPDERTAALGTFWSACDKEADNAGACEEYEHSYAWPHGHAGREDKQERTYNVRVDTSAVISRTYSFSVNADSAEEAEEIANSQWSDYNSDYSSDDDGEEVDSVDVEADDDGPADAYTPLDTLLRDAIEHSNEGRQYHRVAKAGLDAIIAEHAAPITSREAVEVSGRWVLTGTLDSIAQDAAVEAQQALRDAGTMPVSSTARAAVLVTWRGTVEPPRTEADQAAWNGYRSSTDLEARASWVALLGQLARRKVAAAYPNAHDITTVATVDYTLTSAYEMQS